MYDPKKLKEMSLEALIMFDRFCKENGLEYAISFGTELGAVRHGGFIPWDDDLDVDMPIKDYLRFKKAWKKRGNPDYFLQTKENELYKPVLFYQLRKNGTTWIDPGCEDVPMHYGIAIIDIFPVYHAPMHSIFRRLQQKFYSKADAQCRYQWNHRGKNRVVLNFHRILSLGYLNAVWVISALSRGSKRAFYPDGNPWRHVIDADFMFPAKPEKFEGAELMGHNNPDAYLTHQYGDYMTPPPENERGGHAIGIIDLEKDYKEYQKIRRT